MAVALCSHLDCCLRVGRPFFFNDSATTEIYTLSLHDALPICPASDQMHDLCTGHRLPSQSRHVVATGPADRKSTRLNSSHVEISYAVFCLKKKKLPRTWLAPTKCSYSIPTTSPLFATSETIQP